MFAALVVYALERNEKADPIVVDTEYPGHEQFIRLEIVALAKKLKRQIKSDAVKFQPVGKKSPAHNAAWNAYRSRRADRTMTARQVLKLLLN